MTAKTTVRVLLDVNVLISDILSRAARRTNTTSQRLVDAIFDGTLGGCNVQLVISVAMVDTFRDVLLRLGSPPEAAEAAASSLLDLARHGPTKL